MENSTSSVTIAGNPGTEFVMTFSQAPAIGHKNDPVIGLHFSVISASILIIISIVGLIGNLFVILAVSLSRRLQTPTNAFVLTLSCVDFLSALVLPFQAGALLGAVDAYPPYSVVCEVVAAITCVVNFWSFSLLVVIAFARYIIITRPSQNQQTLFSWRKIMLTLVVVLAVPVVILIAFISAGGVSFGYYFLCGVVKGQIFNYLFGVSTLSSMFAMAFCYLGIYYRVRSHARKVKNSMDSMCIRSISTNSVRTKDKKFERRQLNEQITKNLFVVVFCFFICIAPITVTFFKSVHPNVLVAFFILMSVSYSVNPIIYAARHPVFQKVIRCMIARRFQDIDEPSKWLRDLLTTKT